MNHVFLHGLVGLVLGACLTIGGGCGKTKMASSDASIAEDRPSDLMDGSIESDADDGAADRTDAADAVDAPAGADQRADQGDGSGEAGDLGGPDMGTDESADTTDATDAPGLEVGDGAGGGDSTPSPSPCAAGGPSLGILCSGYCSNVDDACPGLYVDFDTCVAVCMRPTWSCGTPADTAVNTLFCRVGHASAANSSTSSAVTECPQAGPNSPTCL